MSSNMKMSFRSAACRTSQFKRFSNLDITKKLAKENNLLDFIASFTPVIGLVFSLKQAASG